MDDLKPEYEGEEGPCKDCGAPGEAMECPFNKGMGGFYKLVFLCPSCANQREYDL